MKRSNTEIYGPYLDEVLSRRTLENMMDAYRYPYSLGPNPLGPREIADELAIRLLMIEEGERVTIQRGPHDSFLWMTDRSAPPTRRSNEGTPSRQHIDHSRWRGEIT